MDTTSFDKLKNIPHEMRSYPQWVVWRYEETTGGKPSKIPYNPKTGRMASVTDPSSWVTYDEAVTAASPREDGSSSHYSGIGFVLTKNDPFLFIDLDATQDASVLAKQMKIFETFGSYSERSPSGNGLHIIIKASVLSGRRRGSIEMYSDARFMTMTGDVYANNAIEERQYLTDALWNEMGGLKTTSGFQGTMEEKQTDLEVYDAACHAANGDKFYKLYHGNWQNIQPPYSSQSEADFALFNIIAFYTQARNQIVRLFQTSALGQREKAQRPDYIEYMLNKVFDRILPPIDIDGFKKAAEEFFARRQQSVATAATSQSVGKGAMPGPYTMPPGLLGDIASFIYDAAPRPVPEIALAAAIAFMSGICGRAYNISGTGVNQYVILLAPTGTGKEAMAGGVNKLMAMIKDGVPAASLFMGPSAIASGQALLKYLSSTSSCFVSIIGEFGYRLQQLSDHRANPSEVMLKQVLLDLYNKSGATDAVQPSVYSQKENNTTVINSPAVTLLGETTPETLFNIVNESMIADGLLPRFLMIEYTGVRPEPNDNHTQARPSVELVSQLKDLASYCLMLMNARDRQGQVLDVQISPDAKVTGDKFRKFADDQINGSNVSAIRQVWSRAHMKLLKLAAIVAIGVDKIHPQIEVRHIEWAKRIVEHETYKLLSRFERGDIGKDNAASKQHNEIKRVISDYLTSAPEYATQYDVPLELHRDKIIPYSFLSRRLRAAAAFRHDHFDATTALKRSLHDLIDSGYLREFGKKDLFDKYGTSQRCFMLADLSFLK